MSDETIITYESIYNPVENTKDDMKKGLLSVNDNNKYCCHSLYLFFMKYCCYLKK